MPSNFAHLYDAYSILRPQENKGVDCRTYRIAAVLANCLVQIEDYNFSKMHQLDHNTILWTTKRNRILHRLLSLEDSPDPMKRHLIRALKNSSMELRLGSAFYEIYENRVIELAKRFNSNGIPLVFFKANKALPLDSNNLDILVKEEDEGEIRSLLRENGFTEVLFYREPYKILFRQTENAEDYVAIHLHMKIAWHGMEFVDQNEIWENCCALKIGGENVRFSDPANCLLITIAHKFFEEAEITLGDVITVTDCLNTSNADIETLLARANAYGWGDIFLACLSLILDLYQEIYGCRPSKVFSSYENLNSTPNVERLFSRVLAKRKTSFLPLSLNETEIKSLRRRRIVMLGLSRGDLVERARFARYMAGGLVRSLSIGNRECKPFVVTIEGLDGSGKTVHSKELLKEFNRRGKRTLYVWSTGSLPFAGKARSILLKTVPKTIPQPGRELPSGTGGLSAGFFDKLEQNRLFASLFTVATVMNHSLYLAIKDSMARHHYDVIIFDRFAHDTIIHSLSYYKKNTSSLFSKMLLNAAPLLMPKPDMIIILYSTPDALVARRPKELIFGEASKKIATYQQYSQIWNAHLVKTTGKFASVHLKLLQLILENFYGKAT